MLTLNIIGAGKVGKSLGRLFVQHQVFQIAQIYNLHQENALEAREFIGQGQTLVDIEELTPADVTLISVPDDVIAGMTDRLLKSQALRPGSILFHCSGAKSSKDWFGQYPDILELGLQVATVHPVRSFADPMAVCTSFAGTICSAEGSQQALAILTPAFTAIGAKMVTIDPDSKLLYHAASVFASNYLVTLMDTAISAYCAAGIDQQLARQMAHSLATNSMENAFAIGTQKALTGPIKRGDMQMVMAQAERVQQWDAAQGNLYQAFIQPTLGLAQRSTD